MDFSSIPPGLWAIGAVGATALGFVVYKLLTHHASAPIVVAKPTVTPFSTTTTSWTELKDDPKPAPIDHYDVQSAIDAATKAVEMASKVDQATPGLDHVREGAKAVVAASIDHMKDTIKRHQEEQGKSGD